MRRPLRIIVDGRDLASDGRDDDVNDVILRINTLCGHRQRLDQEAQVDIFMRMPTEMYVCVNAHAN